VFDHNFALRGMGEPNDSLGEARMALGTEGVGFWFRGPNNFFRNNVAANYQNPTTEAAYGFAFQFRYLGNVQIPKFKGAMNAADFTTMNGNNMPLRQFENNEAYGAMQGGFTYWWISSEDPQPFATGQESVVKNLKLWHIYNKTIYHYPSQKITFDGLTIRGNFSAASRCCGDGVYFPDYSARNIIIRNSDIQGVETGIDAPVGGFGPGPNLLVENTYLRNVQNMNVGTNWSVNGCYMQDKLVEVRNTRFDAPPGRSLSAITMGRANSNGIECLNKLDEVRVYAYNGVASDNFQVYHSNTSVLPRPPAGCTPATRAGFSNAVTCPIAAQGPVAPTATVNVAPTLDRERPVRDLDWSTTNATTVTINQIGTVAASGTQRVSDRHHDLHQLTRLNVRRVDATATAHRHRGGDAHDADDHLECSRQHHLRNRLERDAAERDDDGTGVVGVFAGGRHRSRGGGRTDTLGHVYADRHRQLQLGERDRRDHRAESNAAHHVAGAGRDRFGDSARRHAVERDRERGGDLRVHAAERDGARRGRRADAFGGLHADLERQLQHRQ
jgi:hypothetical protein